MIVSQSQASGDAGPISRAAPEAEPSAADPIIRALFSPSLGQVGCVLIQAAFRGDRRACNIFDARDWFTAPAPDMVWIAEPASAWEAVAAMPRADRIEMMRRAAFGPQNASQAPREDT